MGDFNIKMITVDERTKRRQGLETMEVMINLRANLVERVIRPFTIKRKHSLHLNSDAGAEMAATYHSVINMIKLQNRSAWDYLGKFFTGIFNVCRDYLSLSTQKIDLVGYQ